jgi:hypothetical protein
MPDFRDFIKGFRDALVCVLLISLVFLVFQIRSTVKTADKVVAVTPLILQNELQLTREAVHDELQQTRDFTGEQVSTLTRTADKRLGSIQHDLNNQITGFRGDVTDYVNWAVYDLNSQLTETNKSVAKLTDAYADLPKTVGDRLDPYTDCKNNALCWQNQFTDTLFAVRTTSRDVSKTMVNVQKTTDLFGVEFPKITKNTENITSNINDITVHISKLTTPHWYDRLLGYALNGAILYRSINPVTNLSVQAAQVVTTQK